MTKHVLTANRLLDGSVVYLDWGREWTSDLQRAAAVDDAAELADALAWAAREQQGEVCDPYEIAVDSDLRGRLTGKSARERIRAAGPEVTLARLGYGPRADAPAPRVAVG